MSKFNTKNTIKTTNLGGGIAYERGTSQLDLQKELYTMTVTSLLKKDQYYMTQNTLLNNVLQLTQKIESEEFLMKLMAFTRIRANIRSMAHVLAVFNLVKIKGNKGLKYYLSRTMVRPDDATEIVALWNQMNPGDMIPNALRKAIRHNLEVRWDAYQLKKYYGNGAVKVPDLIKLAHPRPRSADDELMFREALNGTLPSIETAQTINASLTGEHRAQHYSVMLREGKLGIMAALKNIDKLFGQNTITNEITLDMLEDMFSDREKVAKSKVLPFRFAHAYMFGLTSENIDGFFAKKVRNVIEKGFMNSVVNLGLIEEGQTVAVLLDESGSMGGWGENTLTDPFDIGKVMMAALLSGLPEDNAVGLLWADYSRYVAVGNHPMKFVQDTETQGMGTNMEQAIQRLIDDRYFADVVIILTDMQSNQFGSFQRMRDYYHTEVNAYAKFVFWNLNSYGGATPAQLTDDTLELAGFSTSMLESLPYLLKDKDAIIKEIMTY